jgi:hypothetical protein
MVELNDDGTNPMEVWKMEHKKEVVARIAKTYLEIDTLKVQNRDSLDFHDVGVASLEAALIAAFEAGQQDFMI